MNNALTREINRRVGRAMHDYAMLKDKDRVLIAVSGGIDSLVLAWLLDFWRRKAPIVYDIMAVHIDMAPEAKQPGASALAIRRQLESIHIRLTVIPASWRPLPPSDTIDEQRKGICYQCARNRRRQIFDFAGRHGFNKIAFGHHRDDIIETFFLNLCFAGNLSTMVPKQELFDGRLALIRPLAYLEKEEIRVLAGRLGLDPVRTSCIMSKKTRRHDVRNILKALDREIPEARSHIFAALSHVRHGYLLKSSRRGLPAQKGSDDDQH